MIPDTDARLQPAPVSRQPLLRANADPDMALPPGKTCADCVHLWRCCALFSHSPADAVCDFAPSRFQEVRRV